MAVGSPRLTPGPALYTKSNFAPAFWLLPSDRRRALAAVYAFARVVDDAVDETGEAQNRPEEARALLADWRGALVQGDVQRPEHAPLWEELRSALGRFGINKKHLLDLIQGVERDLTQTRYATAADVDVYCDGVASSVGLACLPIFGLTEDRHADFAVALGRAVQWVNILRDVAADARRGRVYLPLDELKRAAVSDADVLAGRDSPGLRGVVKAGAGRARDYFQKAEAALPRSDSKHARPALVMGRLYQGILSKIERGGFNVWAGRVRLSAWDKLRAVLFG
jgi:phytoene synthase